MISKHIEMHSASKSSVFRLVEYITSTQDKQHRLGEIFCANCRYDDPELVSREMLLTQLQNTRSKLDKTYHLLLSFRPGENPDSDTIHQAVAGVCRELGFAEHQHLAAVHYDTDRESIRITRAVSLDTAIMALRIAKQRFGKGLTVHGDEDFRDSMVKAAVDGKVFVQFDDPIMEKKRKHLLYEQGSRARQWRGPREDWKGIEL